MLKMNECKLWVFTLIKHNSILFFDQFACHLTGCVKSEHLLRFNFFVVKAYKIDKQLNKEINLN